MLKRFSLLILACCVCHTVTGQQTTVRIGSKAFNESHILAEMAAQLLEHHDYKVERRLGLGGTLIAFEALKAGDIDLYPEYTGTIAQVVLKIDDTQLSAIRQRLNTQNLQLLQPLGFNNSYAIAIHTGLAQQYNLQTLSDFGLYPNLKVGVSLEFLNREDGWPALSAAYNFQHNVTGIEHALAYRAIANRDIDATDAYTTDGEINSFPLTLLEDDKHFFPQYLAAYFARGALSTAVVDILDQLAGRIDEATMRDLTARVSLQQLSPAVVAREFLLQQSLIESTQSIQTNNGGLLARDGWLLTVLGHTYTHLQLTGIALLLAMLIAIPSALAVVHTQLAAKSLLYVTGLFQTIPALALLALLIPLVGLGKIPAIIALFLYSLLPIFRNTLTGILTVDPLLKQVAAGMGLSPRQQLLHIELPLAAPTIIAGIKTAAIISIGTATLAAFVGAGGLGEPIITGLTLNNHQLILQGAIPAAIFALLVELVFEQIEKRYQPQHLR